MQLTTEAGVILGIGIKTSPATQKNQATIDFGALMNRELADALRCSHQIYEEDGNPLTNFTGVGLKLKAENVTVALSPVAGKGIEIKAWKLKSFSVSPDANGDLQLYLTAVVDTGITDIVKYYSAHCEEPQGMVITSDQEEMFPEEQPPAEEEESGEEAESEGEESDENESGEESEEAPAKKKRATKKKAAAKKAAKKAPKKKKAA